MSRKRTVPPSVLFVLVGMKADAYGLRGALRVSACFSELATYGYPPLLTRPLRTKKTARRTP